MDLATVITLIIAFSVLVTAHVALCVALLLGRPRWRALAALLVPPLAPWWGYREGCRVASIVWVLAFCLYVAAMVTAVL